VVEEVGEVEVVGSL